MFDEHPQHRLAHQVADQVDITPLESIDGLAAQAERIGYTIQSFIDRCRGGGAGTGDSVKELRPSGHLSNLDRLAKNLTRAEELAGELSSIG